MLRETGVLYTVNTLRSSPMSCPPMTWSVAESCSNLDTQNSVGQEFYGLSRMGYLTAVMCLECQDLNFKRF